MCVLAETALFTLDFFQKKSNCNSNWRETLRLTGQNVSHGGVGVFGCDFLI